MGIKFNPLTGNFDLVGSGGGGGGSVTSVNGQVGAVQINAEDVPYDNTGTGISADNVQDAITELKNTRDSETIYVDANDGDDTTGNGSILNPVASIQHALTLVTNPGIGYVIRLAPGTYTGAPINWLPNVDLIGSGANSTQVQSLINYIADPASQTGFNMSLVNASLNLDFTNAAVALPSLFHGTFSVTRVDTQGQGPWAVLISDSTLGPCDFNGSNLLSNCLFTDSCIVRTTGTLLCNDVTVGIQMELEGAASVRLTGCTVPGILNGTTIGMDTPTVQTDAGSLTGATVNNVNVVLTDKSEFVEYDNTTSALTASNVQSAIDEVDNNQDDLIQLTGVSVNSTDLGTFTGSIISDNTTIKNALQELETFADANVGANTTLSNLTSPTAINQNLLPDSNYSRTLGSSSNHFSSVSAASLLSATNAMSILTGASNTSSPALSIGTGNRTNVGATGSVTLVTGDKSVSSTGGTGSVTIASGTASVSASTGLISIKTGDSNGADSGTMEIGTGSGTANTSINSRLDIYTGSSAGNSSGRINISTGNSSGASSGQINIFTGGATTRGPITISGSSVTLLDNVRLADSSNINGFTQTNYIHNITLQENISVPTVISQLSFPFATYSSVIITYSITEQTSLKQKTGTLIVVSDGTIASISQAMSAETAQIGPSTGLEFTTDVSGANVRILYNTTDVTNPCTMRCEVKRFMV